jgi:uncharacterized repeat protein (TIGR03943 family)
MSTRLNRSLQAFVLLAIALFLAAKLISGKLDLYINLRFAPLTVFAIIALALMAYALMGHPRAENHEDDHHHENEHTHSISFYALAFLLLPVLIGVLIPSRPLDAAAASTRGVNVSAPMVGSSQTRPFEAAADQRNILDWIRIFNSERDLTPYLGQTAHVIGFVYKDQRLTENQFLVSRFVITCCSADAVAIGMVVSWDQASTLNENTWVDVKGAVKSYHLDDQPIPLIEASVVKLVDQPDTPYLFP